MKPLYVARGTRPLGLAALFLLLAAPFSEAQAAAPQIERWERHSPNTDGPVYNVSEVTWRLQFDQWVDDVNNDFQLENCSGCNLRISPSNGRGEVFLVTISGDALDDRNHDVTLSIRSNHDIRNANGERLPNNRRHGTVIHEPVYTIRNKPYVHNITRYNPTQYDTNADTLTFRYEFTEPMRNVDKSDFYIENSSADITSLTTSDDTVYLIEVSGGNLPNMNGRLRIYLERDHDLEDADGHELVTRGPQHGDDRAYRIDNIAPRYRYSSRHEPSGRRTTGHSVTFLIKFDEDVAPQTNQFSLVNDRPTFSEWPLATSATSVTKHDNKSNEWLVTFSDLQNIDSYASIYLNEHLSDRVTDLAGNRADGTFHYYTQDELNFFLEQFYDIDNIHPVMHLVNLGDYVTDRFVDFRMDWNEIVFNFVAGDIDVDGGSISSFHDRYHANLRFSMRLTADEEGSVTISVPQNRAQDRLNNANIAFSKTVIFDWTAPRVTSIARQNPTNRLTNSDTLKWRVTFSEPVQNVGVNHFALSGATGSLTVEEVQGTSGSQYDVTAKDGSLANYNGEVSLGLKAEQDTSVQSIADAAGNALTNTAVVGTNDDYLLENTPPEVISITRQDPSSVLSRSTARVTNSDSVTWRVSFSKPVRDVDAGDFTLSNATGTLTVAHAPGSSQTRWDVTAADGNMANFDGVISLGFDPDQNIADSVGNVLTNKTPTGTNEDDYLLDNTAPKVAIEGVPGTTTGPFTATLRFSEAVNGFEIGDIAATGATLSDFTATQAGRVWTVRMTPNADYRLAIAAGVAADAAGNGNLANDGEGARGIQLAAGAGLVLTPESLTIAEGSSGTFEVSLTALPTGPVTVALSSSNSDLTLEPSSLTFTTSDWRVEQTVTASAVEDTDAANESATLTVDPSGGGYDAVADGSVVVTVTDRDARLNVAPVSLTIPEGSSESFTVALAAVPTGPVEVVLSSDNRDVDLAPFRLNFTTSNWSVERKVTVNTARDDDAGDDSASLGLALSGGGYDGVSGGSVSVTVRDDDAGLIVMPQSLTMLEGSSESFTVALAALPTGPVEVALSSNNDDVTLDQETLTFTPSDWDAPQTVTARAGRDLDVEDDRATLGLDPSGGGYNRLADVSLAVTVSDDDLSDAGLTVIPARLTIPEGSSEQFTVALATAPQGRVRVPVSSNHGEVIATPAELVFTPSDWNVPQTVTVHVKEDEDAEDESATLGLDPSGGGFDGLAEGSVLVTVTDSQVAGAGLIMQPESLTLAEGSSGSFTLALAALPKGLVTVALSSDHGDVTTSPAELVFTPTNWDVAQTVTVRTDEDADEEEESATLTLDPSGGGYDDLADGALPVTVIDGQVTGAGLVIEPRSLTLAEGSSGSFAVALEVLPKGPVTVALTSDHDDVTTSPAELVFTPSDWNVAQTVTVRAAEDGDETHENATLTVDPSGGGYDAVVSGSVAVRVEDGPASQTQAERRLAEPALVDVGLDTLSGMSAAMKGRFGGCESALTLAGETVRSGDSESEAGDGDGERQMTPAEALGASAFRWSAGCGGAKDRSWTVWGHGDHAHFGGSLAQGRYDGALSTAWLGVDRYVSEYLVAGAALSRGQGSTDFDRFGLAEETTELTTRLTVGWPYVRLETRGGGALQLVLGVGSGTAEYRREGQRTEEASLDALLASVSGEAPLWRGEGLSLRATGALEVAQMKTGGGASGVLGGLRAEGTRLRAGLEAERSAFRLGTLSLAPHGAAAVAHDAGDGLDGTGLELSGGFRVATADPRFGLSASTRWLALHSADRRRHWGASVEAVWKATENGRGLSLSLAPTWGLQGEGALQGSDIFANLEDERSDGGAALASRLDYGMATLRGGLFTPFVELAVGESRRLTTGTEFEWGTDLAATLTGERREAPDRAPDHRLGLDLRLRF